MREKIRKLENPMKRSNFYKVRKTERKSRKLLRSKAVRLKGLTKCPEQ